MALEVCINQFDVFLFVSIERKRRRKWESAKENCIQKRDFSINPQYGCVCGILLIRLSASVFLVSQNDTSSQSSAAHQKKCKKLYELEWVQINLHFKWALNDSQNKHSSSAKRQLTEEKLQSVDKPYAPHTYVHVQLERFMCTRFVCPGSFKYLVTLLRGIVIELTQVPLWMCARIERKEFSKIEFNKSMAFGLKCVHRLSVGKQCTQIELFKFERAVNVLELWTVVAASRFTLFRHPMKLYWSWACKEQHHFEIKTITHARNLWMFLLNNPFRPNTNNCQWIDWSDEALAIEAFTGFQWIRSGIRWFNGTISRSTPRTHIL